MAPAAALFLLFAGGAHAQSACEQFKATLAARIDPGIRNFSMEAVPADAPVPPGAKVIGTCEGGAQKILFRRTAGPAAAAPDASAAATPAAAPVVTREKSEKKAPEPRPAPVEPVRSVERTAPSTTMPTPASMPSPQLDPPLAVAPSGQRTRDFVARHWPWLLGVVLVGLAGFFGVWFSRRSAYDEAGLPRGPRLN